MIICGQHEKCHLHFPIVLTFTVLAVIFATALTAAGLSGDQAGKHMFEVRLASHEKVEGWEMVPGPGPEKTTVWISPEVALTNGDVEIAKPGRTPGGKLCVLVFFTEDGALKQARLTKSHVGEFLAIILDGRVTMVPRINTEVTGREAMIEGNFTEEEVESIAAGLSGGKIKFEPWKQKFSTGRIKFEIRLASYQKVEGWEIGFVPGPPKTPVWISPEVALTNSDIARAWPQPDAGGFVIGFMLTEEGSLKLARLTKSHIGESVAIMVNGQVMSAPKIMAEITGGRAIIHGTFTEAEAGALAKGIMMK
jgi:preprotein translocase subunit SecD